MMYLSMHKELNRELTSINNKTSDNLFLCLMFFFMTLIFNPLYLLLFFVTLERWIRIPISLNYFLVVSFSLMFINREIGESWSSGEAYANDDALNYIDYYRHIFDRFFFNDLGMTFYSSGEPLWFIIAGIVSFLTNGNEFSIIAVSVIVPIFILHIVFSKISRDFCFNAAFFYIFFPEINHIFYHLWRYSLSMSLTLLLFIYLVKRNKIQIKLFFLSISAHISSLLSLLFISFANMFKNPLIKNKFSNKLIFVLLFFLVFGSLSYSILLSLKFVEFDKFIFYVNSDEILTLFTYNKRHGLYLVISAYLISFSQKKVSIVISLSGLTLLILPFFYSVSLVYERVLILIIPIIIVAFLYEIRFYYRIKNILLFPLFLIAIDLWTKSQGELFYAYMSNGHNFNLFNGMAYNFYDLLKN